MLSSASSSSSHPPFPYSSSSIQCPVSDCPSACDPEARGHRAWRASEASEAMAAVVKSKYMVDPDNAFNLIKWVLTWHKWILLFDKLNAAINNALGISLSKIISKMDKRSLKAKFGCKESVMIQKSLSQY